jgi:hypothetical protein
MHSFQWFQTFQWFQPPPVSSPVETVSQYFRDQCALKMPLAYTPFSKGETPIPLFGKEGLGEIFLPVVPPNGV